MSYSPEEWSGQLHNALLRAVLPKTRISIAIRLLHHEMDLPATHRREYKRWLAWRQTVDAIVQDAADGFTLKGRVRRWFRRWGRLFR